jgi:ribosome-associated protein
MAKRPGKTGKTESPLDKARAFAVDAARLLEDDKCTDIALLDVSGISQVTDFIVIGSGTSERQMRSVLGHVEELGAGAGFQAFRTSADERASWLLADFVHVVVHLFEPNTRAHYDLEMLWGDAPRVKRQRAKKRTGGTAVPQES